MAKTNNTKKSLIARALFFAPLILVTSLILTSCGSTTAQKKTNSQYKQRLFTASYDSVWKALQLSLQNYPILVNNYDKGLLKTDFLSPDEAWSSDTQKGQFKSSAKYQIIVNAIKSAPGPKQTVRVRVKKLIFNQKDFFSGVSKQTGNGYEETVILYRIHRELQLEKRVQKINQP